MEEIDQTERGEKYDLKFVSKLAVALWGHERLAVSSVTGRRSNNNPSSNPMPTIQLEPEKLSYIKGELDEVFYSFDEELRLRALHGVAIQNFAKRNATLD